MLGPIESADTLHGHGTDKKGGFDTVSTSLPLLKRGTINGLHLQSRQRPRICRSQASVVYYRPRTETGECCFKAL